MGDKACKMTTIGGQALIEGLMMIGPKFYSIAVRKPDGEIFLEKKELPPKGFYNKIPFLRGSFLLFRQMILGMKALMKAADLIEIEEEEKPSKFESFLERICKDKLKDVVIYFSVIVSILLSVSLFVLLPTFIAGLFPFDKDVYSSTIILHLIEGVVRVILFMSYLIGISKLSTDMKRVWQYHGAEHKAIYCYENGDDLTVENVQKYSVKHPRCGTSFLFMVVIVSIIIFSFTGWNNSVFVNAGIRIALLPLVAGITYELFKIIGKKDNKFFRILRKPGLMFQTYTTDEPDNEMVEVAIKALESVIDNDSNEDKW